MAPKNKNRDIKILHIITNLTVGGAQENTFLTTRYLREQGYKTDIAAAPNGQWEEKARHYCDNLHLIKELQENKFSFLSNISAIRDLIKLIRKHHYDVVHTHSTIGGICGRLAAYWLGVPFVVHTLHGFSYHEAMPRWKQFLLKRIEAFFSLLTDIVITVCDNNQQEALENKLVPKEKVVTIYSGIDFERFNLKESFPDIRQVLSIPEESYIVGFVGRLCYQKAPERFIQAAKEILLKRKDVHFILVGDGPLRNELESLAMPRQNIHFLGMREDIPAIMSAIDVFALTSRYEGLGRSLTEAMYCRKAVVAANVNGVSELVEHEKTGLLIESTSIEALVDSIERLLEDSSLRKSLGDNAYEKVYPDFCAIKMGKAVETLYLQHLTQKKTSC